MIDRISSKESEYMNDSEFGEWLRLITLILVASLSVFSVNKTFDRVMARHTYITTYAIVSLTCGVAEADKHCGEQIYAELEKLK